MKTYGLVSTMVKENQVFLFYFILTHSIEALKGPKQFHTHALRVPKEFYFILFIYFCTGEWDHYLNFAFCFARDRQHKK